MGSSAPSWDRSQTGPSVNGHSCRGVAAPRLLWQQHVAFGRVLSQRQLLAWGKCLVPPARLSSKNVLWPPKCSSNKPWFCSILQNHCWPGQRDLQILPCYGSAASLTHCMVLCSRFDCHFKLTEDPRPLTSRRRQSSSVKILLHIIRLFQTVQNLTSGWGEVPRRFLSTTLNSFGVGWDLGHSKFVSPIFMSNK